MIPLFKVHTPDGVADAVASVWESGFVTEGEYSDKFENMFGEYVHNPNTSLVNSCTSALALTSRMCGIQAGDEVITTPMTCMATNEPFFNDGARLVWADIDPTTGNMDPDSVRKLITPKTKAIVGVHWAGQPFDIDAINSIASNHGIKVVEDAAHALGATYNGKPIGSHSDYTCFSFQAIKHITTADGGAICSKTAEDDQRIKSLRWFGLNRKYQGSKWEQDITESGFKYHMNNTNSIIGILQMNHVHDIVNGHKRNYHFYNDNINNSRVIKMRVDPKSESSCWIYTVLVKDREDFMLHLAENGIASDPVHVRNDTYSVFKDFRRLDEDLPGAREFCSQHVNIPVGWWLSEDDRNHIVRVVNRY
jgi:dTDP-4-amino-4,6-dideoxygalactose transaminase